jgi:hypothetical protein
VRALRERRASEHGNARDLGDHDAGEGVIAERVIVVLLAVLRAGTLALGAAEIAGSSSLRYPTLASAALAALTGQSMLLFGFAAARLHQGRSPAFGELAAPVETAAAVAGLLVVAYATPLSLRTTSTFWIEPYTVISVLVLAASVRRASVGAAGAACLTVAYLLCVFVVAPNGGRLSIAEHATAWTNAISYLPFFAIGAIGFAVLRSVVRQTDALRRLLGRLSEERARVATAKHAYDIGHDIPKALLREVRRGRMSAEQLRPWAQQFRKDLALALGGEERRPVDLHEELAALAGALAAATPLHAELHGLGEMPAGAPTLLIAEAARELLSNASHHAYGFPATLTARSSVELVQVVVHNEGPKVDPARLASTWARKQNTLHQLQAAGGSYEIHSGVGTTVTVSWPASAAGAAEEGV